MFIEFDLFRNCKMGAGGEEGNEFWVNGIVRLVQAKGDSLTLVQTIDTVDIAECTCTYNDHYHKTKYASALFSSYEKALQIARRMEGFTIARPKEILFNDTLKTTIYDASSDTSYSLVLNYNDLFVIDLELEDIISCHPDKASEVRSYETDHFTITILRLRCSFLDEEAITHNKQRFELIETAFWKEQAQWHGIAKDYWVVTSKTP